MQKWDEINWPPFLPLIIPVAVMLTVQFVPSTVPTIVKDVAFSLSATALACGLTWGAWHIRKGRSRLLLFLGWLASMTIAMTLAYYGWLAVYRDAYPPPPPPPPPVAAPKPDRTKVTPLVSVSGVNGEDLDGEILIRNDSNQAVTLLAYQYNAFGGHLTDHVGPDTIPAYGSYPIVIEDLNKLMKSARLDLRYDFKFVGDETLYKGQASFVIPEHPRKGEQIGPRSCCSADDAPALSDEGTGIEEKLRESEGNFGFDVRDQNGLQTSGEPPFQMVRFDPIARYVMFLSGPANNQVVLVSGINRVPTGEHWIQLMWNVKKKQYWMASDGHPARRISKAEIDAARKQQPF